MYIYKTAVYLRVFNIMYNLNLNDEELLIIIIMLYISRFVTL